MKRFVAVLLMAPACATVMAQEKENQPGEWFEQQQEQLAAQEESETEDDSQWQHLEYRRKHRLNLNTATAEELSELNLLTDLQVYHIIRYRQLLGKLLHLYEMQAIPTLDMVTIRKLVPLVAVYPGDQDMQDLKRRFAGGEKTLLLRLSQGLEKAKGFLPADSGRYYPGSPLRMMFRYRYQYRDLLQYGITGDKDAGEQFLKGKQANGFDFYSFHFFIRRWGMVRSLAVGDYTISLGQGLIHGQGQGTRKSAGVTNIKRQGAVLKPYSAAGEFNFHRGAAVTLQHRRVQATAFVSLRKWSASIKEDSAGGYVSSISTSGLHRTGSEHANKNRLNYFAAGANIQYNTSRLHLGINAIQHRFAIPLRAGEEPYERFAMWGNNWYNYSADYSFTFSNVHVFGEIAADKNGRHAMVHGLMLSADPAVDVALVYRRLPAAYRNMGGNAFTESSRPENETGFYAGISIRPVYGMQFDAYADWYRFPWLRYRVDAPSRGVDYLLQWTWTPGRHTEVVCRYRIEEKEANGATSWGGVHAVMPGRKRNLRTQVSFRAGSAITLRQRMEALWFESPGSGEKKTGFLCYVDLRYDKPWQPWSGSIRLQYFETPDYDARIYAYESTVLYNASVPAWFNTGIRSYINFSYKWKATIRAKKLRKLSCLFGLHMSAAVYAPGTVLGSGQDELPGNRKSEWRVQWLISLH